MRGASGTYPADAEGGGVPVAVVMPLGEQRGGAEMMLMRLLRANRCSPGSDYRIGFLSSGPMVAEVRGLGYEATVFEAGRLREGGRYARTVYVLANWLRAIRAGAVLSWMPKAHLYAGPAALRRGVPALWFQHMAPSGHWTERIAARIPAAGVLCCSEWVASAQRDWWPRVPTRVIYPAIETCEPPSVGAAAARRRCELPPDRPVIGIAARLQGWKGLGVFVEAARSVRAVCPEAFFVIVGGAHAREPGYQAELERRVEAVGLAECFRFAGQQTEMPLWFEAMDIVVHASTEPEPFGMVVIEAMAQGKPVIAAGCGGPVEVITDGVDGLLVPPGDEGALARGLLRLLGSPGEREALGRAARLRAQAFGPDRLARAVAASIGEVSVPSYAGRRGLQLAGQEGG